MKQIELPVQEDSNYHMDIKTILFKYDPIEFKNKIDRARKILTENRDLLSEVVVQTITNSPIIISELKNEDSGVYSRLDGDEIKVTLNKVELIGYSKWNEDTLIVNLNKLLN